MYNVLFRSIVFTLAICIITLLIRIVFQTGNDLNDLGELGSFITAFGTVYGVTIGFVVVEVWSQNIETQSLIDRESRELEALYDLASFFVENQDGAKLNRAIYDYTNAVLEDRFEKLGQGERSKVTHTAFNEIHDASVNLPLDDQRDLILFDHMVPQHSSLRVTRTERISQGFNRLPEPLNIFLYVTSGLTLFSFTVMPFANIIFSMISVGILAFLGEIKENATKHFILAKIC